METVSIIVPSLGENEDMFKRCVQSLLNQSGVKVHLILSTVEGDNCIDWIKELKGDITVIIKPLSEHIERSPLGSFDQIQRAVPYLKGNYMFYHSSNDICYYSKSINEINRIESQEGKSVCYSAFDIFYPENNKSKTREFPKQYTLEEHLKRNFIYDSSMIKTELFKKYMPFCKWYNCGYYDLWLRIFKGEGDVFTYNTIPTKAYIQHNNSMHIQRSKDINTTVRHAKDREEMLSCHKKVFGIK